MDGWMGWRDGIEGSINWRMGGQKGLLEPRIEILGLVGWPDSCSCEPGGSPSRLTDYIMGPDLCPHIGGFPCRCGPEGTVRVRVRVRDPLFTPHQLTVTSVCVLLQGQQETHQLSEANDKQNKKDMA